MTPQSPLGALPKFQYQAADDSDGVEEVPVLKMAPPKIDLELDLDSVIADLFTEPQPRMVETAAVAETPQKTKKAGSLPADTLPTPVKPAPVKPKKTGQLPLQ